MCTIKQKDPEHESKLRVSSRMCQQVCLSVCFVGSCAMCSSLNCDCMCLRVHKSHMELLIVIWHRFWEGLDVPMIALITDFHPPPLLLPLTGRLQQFLLNLTVERKPYICNTSSWHVILYVCTHTHTQRS